MEKDKKDYVVEVLVQLNDDMRNKLISFYSEAKAELAAKEKQIDDLKVEKEELREEMRQNS